MYVPPCYSQGHLSFLYMWMLWQSFKVIFGWPLSFYLVLKCLYCTEILLLHFLLFHGTVFILCMQTDSVWFQMKHVCICSQSLKWLIMVNNYCLPQFCFLYWCLSMHNIHVYMALCLFLNVYNRWFWLTMISWIASRAILKHPVTPHIALTACYWIYLTWIETEVSCCISVLLANHSPRRKCK